MSRNCHYKWISAGTVAIALTAAGCSSSTAAKGSSSSNSAGAGTSSAAPVTYGVIAPYSGSSAFIGSISNSGVYPAVNEINASGGVLGHRVAVQIVDTKGDPADALPSVQQFLSTTSNILGVSGPTTVGAPTLVPILNNAKTPMISAAGEAQYDRSTAQYFWRLTPPDAANGVAMALYAKSRGWTRAATVFGTDAGSQGDLPGVQAGARALGLSLVAQVSLSPSQPSYSSQVARVLAQHPQVIFTETGPDAAATFFGELGRQTQSPVPIVGTAATVVGPYLSPTQKAVGAARFAEAFRALAPSSEATPATKVFTNWLLKSGSKVPNPKQWIGNFHSETNYDGVILEALAATDAGSASGARYNADMTAIANPGAGKTTVYSYAQGVKLLKQHKAIRYVGAGGPINFNQYHNSFAPDQVLEYTAQGQLQQVGTITTKQINSVHVPSK